MDRLLLYECLGKEIKREAGSLCTMTEIIIPTLEECVLDPLADLPPQPEYHIPEAFEPVWFTYQRPDLDTSPHHLFIYHALPNNRTLLHHVKRAPDNKEVGEGTRWSELGRGKGHYLVTPKDGLILQGELIKTDPLHKATKEKILNMCTKVRDCGAIIDAAYFPHIMDASGTSPIRFASAFAQLYFINEYYSTNKGREDFSDLIQREQVDSFDLPQQPEYSIPHAFDPAWFTHRRPETEDLPHNLIIYHALPDNGTLLHNVRRLPDKRGMNPGARSMEMGSQKGKFVTIQKDRFAVTMDRSIKTDPLHESTQAEISKICSKARDDGSIFDAVFFPHVVSEPGAASLRHAAAFAQFYFMNEFYDSEVGDESIRRFLEPPKQESLIITPDQVRGSLIITPDQARRGGVNQRIRASLGRRKK